MRNIHLLYIFLIALVFTNCKEVSPKQPTVNSSSTKAYWVDKTDTYLPETAEWTNRVEVADINGDGRIDILCANGGNYSEPGAPESIRVFINKGIDTKFEEITENIFAQNKFLSRVIKVRDINNDSIPDIILGTTYQTQSQLYLGTGNGNFKNVTATHFPKIKASIGDMELGDVDFDGNLDIVLSDWGEGTNMNNSGGRTMLWINDGTGKFTDVTETHMPEILIQFSWDLEFIDFDNDFDLDIAISCKRCATSRIFVNDGKGAFKDKRLLPAYTNNYDFEVMDINNDGFLDLITVNDGEIVGGKSFSRREHIFLNKEGKRFEDLTHELWSDEDNIGEDDNNIVFLDFDSDGDPDFLISSLTGEDRLLLNDGNGKFSLKQPVLFGNPTPLTLSMVLGDINNDKKLDIIMGQGEGKKGIEERIFIGKDINPDSASPIISHFRIIENHKKNIKTIMARIHNNKSPNMPEDWESVLVFVKGSNEPIPMVWYGENLWATSVDIKYDSKDISICATDYSGNKTCKQLI
ncbi:FG-GAP repeat domain-containing protein [Hyunsoonleella aestuarii]|uniref:VCBS repeat-containing protein n=1 Tax=Hyunsoonleella aestuarii TaxID=912802 RepID=A0ABP8E9M5_9FLAO|nr:VCBS repeat-containing protein [Hyunsoonleella aestuarii]